ncbi:Ethylmalonyl-CoA decarboxylase [Strongyloides ratti]|uniref:3-hydroxyisobutyryl-CoA hydrolase n=1 Tax=Strongyloides ratti TaxID=34506 RepID=A0A090MYE4_STRRB|nr:Ethylmalonyl-CoA decarboxylase [Strongyloides ratti]CEF67039.1 Ethylmalonyl-CoA decarboxylase [Strongyloides ratti]
MIRRTFSTASQHYTKANYNIDEARIIFNKFSGGKVTLEKNEEKGIGKICIDNEKKLNAITGKMFVDFEKCVNELKEWENGKIVIIEGKGSNFCSGGNLNFVKEIATPELGYWMNSYFGGVLQDLRGGTEIATNCDLRFMHTSGRFGVIQGKMGVVQTWNGASKLIEIVALEMGLVDEIYETDDEFNKIIDKLAQKDVNIIRTAKEMYMELSNAKGLSSKELHDIELKYSSKLWGSEHHLLALNSKIKN